MPTVVIQPGATIFVTGVNGLIGSVVADQLLARGYNVRGAVRGVEKNKWLAEYFQGKYKSAKFDLVDVPDMTVEGCYDGLVDGKLSYSHQDSKQVTYNPSGTEGFIHLASPVGGIQDLNLALDIGRAAGLSALKACAKTPSVTRFVNTSSSAAATMPKPHLDHDFIIDEKSFNDEALQRAKSEDTPTKVFLIYASMKSETEKAMWKWVAENKPGFVLNSIVS
jgi:nucleoside-diphosphate-sugar epimerase